MSPSKTTIETGTTALTGLKCFAITFVTATVFSVLTGAIAGDITTVTFPAGLTIYGNFTEITLSSGSVIIYEMP